MVSCVQCGKDIKSIGGTVLQTDGGDISLVNIYVCFAPACPNFCLTQVGLSEVEKE